MDDTISVFVSESFDATALYIQLQLPRCMAHDVASLHRKLNCSVRLEEDYIPAFVLEEISDLSGWTSLGWKSEKFDLRTLPGSTVAIFPVPCFPSVEYLCVLSADVVDSIVCFNMSDLAYEVDAKDRTPSQRLAILLSDWLDSSENLPPDIMESEAVEALMIAQKTGFCVRVKNAAFWVAHGSRQQAVMCSCYATTCEVGEEETII